MAGVLVSNHPADVEKASIVRSRLEALGIELIDDKTLSAARVDDEHFNLFLLDVVTVVVLWTNASTKLNARGAPINYVIRDAIVAYRRGVLVAAVLDEDAQTSIPAPFDAFQKADLSDWIETGTGAAHPQWQDLLDTLGKRLQRPGLAQLALTIEDGTDTAKRAFLRNYPEDALAHRLKSELISREQDAFEQRMRVAQDRINTRAQEAEQKLRRCRQQFEEQLVGFSATEEFWPPDPVAALDDNVAKLHEQLNLDQDIIRELQNQLDSQQKSITELQSRLEKTGGQAPGRLRKPTDKAGNKSNTTASRRKGRVVAGPNKNQTARTSRRPRAVQGRRKTFSEAGRMKPSGVEKRPAARLREPRAQNLKYAKIAISYRRNDSDAITGRIFDRLIVHYGKDSVFRDIDNIPSGIDFREHINITLQSMNILIAVIGPKWRGKVKGKGVRIEDEDDLVRVEVETALERRIPVIPVLVGNASMPGNAELPTSLRELRFRNAVKVDAREDFDHHVGRLIRDIDQILSIKS